MKKLYVNNQLIAMGDYTIIEKEEPSKYRIEIRLDLDYDRDENNYWNEETTFYSNHRNFKFDGEVDDDLIEKLEQKEVDGKKYYPVYMFDHSGYALSKHPFNDKWDSGMLGIAEVDNSDGNADFIFDDFFTELKAYMEGEVYGFIILDELDDWVDSCWGFYGTKSDIIDSMFEHISEEYGITREDIEKAFEDIKY